jgi:hypothetical protein
MSFWNSTAEFFYLTESSWDSVTTISCSTLLLCWQNVWYSRQLGLRDSYMLLWCVLSCFDSWVFGLADSWGSVTTISCSPATRTSILCIGESLSVGSISNKHFRSSILFFIFCIFFRLLYSTLSLLFQYLLPGVAITMANSRIYR